MRERATLIKGLKTLGRLLALQGTALFALFLIGQPVLEAAQSRNLTIKVRLNDSWGPNAVMDLSAVQRSAEGEVLLNWTAPSDYENPVSATPPAVQQYEIRYATFNVAAVGGSTTTWWNAATVYAPASSLTPGTPAGSDFIILSGLPAVPHYFSVRSVDARGNVSALDAGTTGGAQASATPRGGRPAPVAGLLGFANPDTSYNILWNPVTLNEDGSLAVDISSYVVRRASSFNGPFTTASTSGAGASNPGFSEASAPAQEQYLQIVARDASGNESDPVKSNLLHVTPQGIIGQVALAGDGSATRAYVPSTLMGELHGEAGDLLVKVSSNHDQALNRDPSRTLATYDVRLVSPAAQAVDKNFIFSRPAMSVVLQYDNPAAAASNQTVGVLWWNGTTWVKIGAAEVDNVLKTASFKTALPGTYQVRAFQAATELTLEKSSVFPRIFTPNGDGINDQAFFVIENPRLSTLEGKVYDVQGIEVGDLKPAGAGAPTPDTMIWDGKDKNGSVVPAGVYVYRVKGEGKSMTGTVVVAK
jgi:hypothetical protein